MSAAESLAQGAVERLLENESLRGDLTDAGFAPIVDWATTTLIAAAHGAAQSPDEEAQRRMDEAEAAVKAIVGDVVQVAQSRSRADLRALTGEPAVARNLGARLRLNALAWRLAQDADANAMRLIKALRGVQL